MDTVISFYKFVPIEDPRALQGELKKFVETACPNMRGSILLATEGINSGLSAPQMEIDAFGAYLRQDPRFSDIQFKESYYEAISYRRMLVKVRKEIVTMGIPDVDSIHDTGAFLSPATLDQWYKEKRPMIVVDTRNDYEYQLGTFQDAINPKTTSFRQFPQWVEENLSKEKDTPIVTFCTGGIRCEKATAFMRKAGFKEVYQLDGGILRYLEATKTQPEIHWEGDCVVFDKRKGLDRFLNPTAKPMCFVCLGELTPAITASRSYEAGEACIPCSEKMELHAKKRQEEGRKKQALYQENRKRVLAATKKQYASAIDMTDA